MWIEQGNTVARVVRATDDETSWLLEYLSFPDAAARWRRGSDGRIRLFNVLNNTFPAGFMSMVLAAAKTAGFTVEIIDKRSASVAVDPHADLAWLRWYQKEAVERAVAKERGIFHLPTGAGKTEIAAGIARALPCKWLFLVHRSSLMEQAAERYERRAMQHDTGDDVAGRIGDGVWAPGERFTAATFQTIAAAFQRRDPRVFELMEQTQGLIVDEAHVLPANTFYAVGMSVRNARYRFGLSGTPLQRTDKRSMHAIAALGPVIHRVKTETLIEEGVLAVPEVTFVRVQQPPSDKHTWAHVYGQSVVRSQARNALVLEAVRRASKPALVFTKETAHGKLLTKELERAGFHTEFVYGKTHTKSRMERAKALAAGRLDVLVASVVFQEGIDIPELRSVVVASGGESVIAALQRIGRGMRRTDGKSSFEVYDFLDVDCGCRAAAKALGGSSRVGVHKSCKWLAKHAKARMRSYVSEGHKTHVEEWIIGGGVTGKNYAADDTDDGDDGDEDSP